MFHDWASENAVVTTKIRLRFDGRSTAKSKVIKVTVINPLAAITLTYLFI